MRIKQAIVVRTKYTNSNGKLKNIKRDDLMSYGVAASNVWLCARLQENMKTFLNGFGMRGSLEAKTFASFNLPEANWLGCNSKLSFHKVESSEELQQLHRVCCENNLTSFIISDSVGQSLESCPVAIGIGPHDEESIDYVIKGLENI